MMDKSGQCLCGAVKFTLRGVKPRFWACHCKMCQRWAGSALMTVVVQPDAIEFEGLENVATYQSSDWAERGWCRNCGSNIWYRMTGPGPHQGRRHISVGLLDDPDGLTLGTEIFIDEKSSAFAYAGDTKKLTGAEVIAQFAPKDEE